MELLLTPLQFDIPNSRLRYYMLAKKLPLSFYALSEQPENRKDEIWRHIPGHGTDWSDPRQGHAEADNGVATSSVRPLKDYLSVAEDLESFRIPEKVLVKWGRLFDIVKPSSRRTCCFTRGWCF